MSNIPKARELLDEALTDLVNRKYEAAFVKVELALDLHMTRTPAVRKARKKSVKITDTMRDRIETLALNPNRTMAEIADMVGLRNSGRVSEVLNGLR